MLRAIYCIDCTEQQVARCGVVFVVKLFSPEAEAKSLPVLVMSLKYGFVCIENYMV
jgi:hypothetical protein